MREGDPSYKELSRYSELDRRGVGFYVSDLLAVRGHAEDSGMTVEFSEALDKELAHWLNRFKKDSEIKPYIKPGQEHSINVLRIRQDGEEKEETNDILDFARAVGEDKLSHEAMLLRRQKHDPTNSDGRKIRERLEVLLGIFKENYIIEDDSYYQDEIQAEYLEWTDGQYLDDTYLK